MAKYGVIFVLVLWLGGCQYVPNVSFGERSPTPEVGLFLACKGYATSLRNIALFRQKLDVRQVELVENVISLVGPICRDAASGKIVNVEAMLAAVNVELRRLLLLEQGVR